MGELSVSTRLLITGGGFVAAGFLFEVASGLRYADFLSASRSYTRFRADLGSRSEALKFILLRSFQYVGIVMVGLGVIARLVGL